MKLYRLRIEPTSAWRTPWQADTVMGLLCWLIARTEGAEILERDVLGPARRKQPRFVLSDAFPDDLLPVPTAIRLLPVPAGSRKLVKRARWMERADFLCMQRGLVPSTAALLSGEGRERRQVQIRNMLDRARDGSLGVYPQPESLLGAEASGLTLYARIAPGWEIRLLALFHELSQVGFGADSSIGKGQFNLGAAFESEDDLDDVRDPNAIVSLSTFQPDPESRPDGVWEIFTKYGKLGPDFGVDVFKRPLVMLRPGACLRSTGLASPFAGRFLTMDMILAADAATKLRERGIDIGHLAYGLAVPARLDWEALDAASPSSKRLAPGAPSPGNGTEGTYVLVLLDLEGPVPESPIRELLPPSARTPHVLYASRMGAPAVRRHGPDAEPVDWAGIGRALVRIAEAVRELARGGSRLTFWISGLAPLPAFVHLGMLLSAWSGDQILVNRRKDGTLDVMPLSRSKRGEPFFDLVTGFPKESSAASGRLAVFVSTGLQPEKERLRTFILEGGEPYAGLVEIRTRESRYLDDSNAASAAEELATHLSRIPGAFPRAQDIAIFVAGPASLAFIAGRAINPNVIRSTWVANRTGVGPSGHELAFTLPLRPGKEPEVSGPEQDESETQERLEDVYASGRAAVRIEEVRLSHFRAIEDARLSLSGLTVLVGRNGAGKTTVADALDFLRDALTEGLEIAIERRGGIEGIRQRSAEDTPRGELPAVSIAVVMRVATWPEPSLDGARGKADDISRPSDTPPDERVLYGMRLRVDPVSAEMSIDEVLRTVSRQVSFERHGNDLTFSIKGAVKPALSGASLALPLVADLHPGWRMVLDAFRNLRVHTLSPAAIRNEPPIGSATYLLRDGANAGDSFKALEADKRDVSWIVDYLAGVTPGILGVRAGSQAGRRTLGFLQQGAGAEARPITFRGAEMSDGTLRALGVLLALRQRPTPSLVFIDEIEDSVHPAALHVLLDAAAATASERCQVVLTSHSPEVLSHPAVTADNVRVLTWRNGRSRVHLLSEGTRASLVPPDTVGDLLRINALEPDEVPERVEGDIFSIE